MKTKKIISWLVVMCLMLSLFAVPTYAADTQTFDFSENGDGSIIGTYNPDTKTLDIEGTGAMKKYTTGTSPVSQLVDVEVINIGEGITEVRNCFGYDGSNYFKNLKELNLPTTLT